MKFAFIIALIAMLMVTYSHAAVSTVSTAPCYLYTQTGCKNQLACTWSWALDSCEDRKLTTTVLPQKQLYALKIAEELDEIAEDMYEIQNDVARCLYEQEQGSNRACKL